MRTPIITDKAPLAHRVRNLVTEMCAGAYEREEAISLSLLAALSGESIFLLGLPGVGKSMIARRLKQAFQDARCFEYLMSRFSTPDEIFGPVSISKLKDADTYERVVDGYLPTADIVFLDEIWKAGPAIQNSLLTAINEKIFHNGDRDISLPVKGIIAASNELPAEGEGLEALWDRFLIRYVVQPIREDRAFLELIGSRQTERMVSVTLQFSESEYRDIRQQRDDIVIPDEIMMMIASLRRTYIDRARAFAIGKGDDDETLIPYVSDRRWKKIAGILRTSALLNGRDEVNLSDCLLLEHLIWDRDTQMGSVQKDIAEAVCKCLVHYCVHKSVREKEAKDNVQQFYSPDEGVHYLIDTGKEKLPIAVKDYLRLTPMASNGRFDLSGGVSLTGEAGEFLIRSAKEGTVSINNFTYPLVQVQQVTGLEGSDSVEMSVHRCTDAFREEVKENVFLRPIEEYPSLVSRLDRLA